MTENIKYKTITCNNCNIIIKPKKTGLKAVVKWDNGTKQTYTNEYELPNKENVFIIPHNDQGFYYLNNNKIIHIIDDIQQKIIVYDDNINHNWFGSFDNDDILYFPKYNTLICTFFGGDHDYIWWWKLNEYDQYADIENPLYYNGIFNASLDIYKANDRYAVGTYDNYTDSCCGDDEDSDDENRDVLTIIFDTKKMIYYEYTREELIGELGIETNMKYSKMQKKIINKMFSD